MLSDSPVNASFNFCYHFEQGQGVPEIRAGTGSILLGIQELRENIPAVTLRRDRQICQEGEDLAASYLKRDAVELKKRWSE